VTLPQPTLREHQKKLRRVRAWLGEVGADFCALTLQSNFAWITGGRENRVYSAMEAGAATVVVSTESAWLVANNIEMPRLMAEEVGGLNLTPAEFFWEDPSGLADTLKKLCPGRLVADTPLPGAEVNTGGLARLRWQLTQEEADRYRALGRDTADAVEEAAHCIHPGMSEHEIAAEISLRVMRRGVQPGLILVAVDDRAFRFRHPLPTSAVLRRHAMLVCCGRRGGLVASVTRMVSFGTPEADMARRHRAVCAVDSAFIDATRPGTPVKDVFAAGLAEYAAQGFPNEWRLHHQGGATGYGSREYKGTHTCPEVVLDNQAFAWNPSIAGTKSEDTILACGGVPEILTEARSWPMITEFAVPRPDILVR
jgi:Xaa-Pro aminopeptidase